MISAEMKLSPSSGDMSDPEVEFITLEGDHRYILIRSSIGGKSPSATAEYLVRGFPSPQSK